MKKVVAKKSRRSAAKKRPPRLTINDLPDASFDPVYEKATEFAHALTTAFETHGRERLGDAVAQKPYFSGWFMTAMTRHEICECLEKIISLRMPNIGVNHFSSSKRDLFPEDRRYYKDLEEIDHPPDGGQLVRLLI